MAEAHQAVSYSSSLIHEHTDASNEQQVLKLVWQSGLRYWKKRFAQFINKVRNGVYPAHIESLFVIISLVMALHFSIQKMPFDLVNFFIKTLPDTTIIWQLFACIQTGFIYWIAICFTMRYTLKFLLMYKGYMFEARGKKVSLQTKVWGILVKIFLKWNTPGLYSFQGSMPRMPVPSIKGTVSRYLRSVRPLLDDKAYEKVCKEASDFEKGIGNKLQRYLVLKSWWSSNYVSDWWEEYVYLKSRVPLMINSNFYGSDIDLHLTKSQSARAANLTYCVLQMKKTVERQQMKPIMAQGLVPLCSWQYERLYNTVRVPGIEGDKIVHYSDSNHIIAMHKGCYYKIITKHNGRILKPLELQHQIEYILRSSSNATKGEINLASLTAWNRTKWAEAREKYFSNGINKESLHEIESAAFMLALDDEPYEFGLNVDSKQYGYYGQQLLHGKGNNRWFDKNFNLCISSNGRAGINGEHTWGDAPILAHLHEECIHGDTNSYDENGNLRGVMEITPPTPIKIKWEFNEQLLKTIDEAFEDAQKLISDVDHHVLAHKAFGKGFIKTCRLSPDAFIQMALQLAYYRDQGNFTLTYEASMTRLYREGRTETVRSCTIESSAWVKAMEDKTSNTQERVKLLNEACKRHQVGYLDAMCGRGIDRHLFCLYVVSKYLEIDEPFLKEALSEPWRLSTSQTPLGQASKVNFQSEAQITSAGGGFGPVSYEGYAVSYIISGEDLLYFHVSSMKGYPKTNTERFVNEIKKAMGDIKNLFEDFSKKT